MKNVEIKVLMYKASAPSADYGDKLIAWWTHSKYSHCEIVVDDMKIAVYRTNGVVCYDYEGVNDEEFDVIPLELTVTAEHLYNFWRYVNTHMVGKKYDGLNIGLSQIVKIGIQDNNRYTCSEATTKVLQVLGVPEVWPVHPGDMSPGDLSELLTGKR